MAAINAPRAIPRAIRRARWPNAPVHTRHAATAAAVEHHEPQPYISDIAPPVQAPVRTDRKQSVRDAKPFSDFLTDTFHRQHDYLRISVTERCNLRCLYCMPEEGIQLSPNKEILTSAEIVYLSALFVNQGVSKIRLTGGEPTVRKDIVPLMQQIGSLRRDGLKELALTTNAISLHRKLDAMVEAGLTGVNISLDTLDPFQFQLLTRRQGFDTVMKSINRIQEMNGLGAGVKLKINAVVMRGLNDHQLLPFVEKTRNEDIEVRFIEYMPFGGNKWSENKMMPYSEMLDKIREQYPDIGRLKGEKNDTSKVWQVPGFKGRVGFITSMTHNFCGTCNRLRITSDGNLKVCLHGNTEVSLRDLLRKERSGEPMDDEAFEAVRQIELDRRKDNGLRFDGEEGWMSKEQQLLEVIGAAVKRKQARHAGMENLQNMKNRPMILIGGSTSSKFDTFRDHLVAQSSHQSDHVLYAGTDGNTDEQSGRQPRPAFMSRRMPILRHNQFQTPWTRIPTHLLGPSALSHSQIRFSSSNTSKAAPVEPPSNVSEPTDAVEQSSSFASTFGFQSLSGLFDQRSTRGRYSQPRKPEVESGRSTTVSSGQSRPASENVKARPGFFQPSSSTAESTAPADVANYTPTAELKLEGANSGVREIDTTELSVTNTERKKGRGALPVRRHSGVLFKDDGGQSDTLREAGRIERRSSALRSPDGARRAPIQRPLTSRPANRFATPPDRPSYKRLQQQSPREPKKAWGLSDERTGVLDPVEDKLIATPEQTRPSDPSSKSVSGPDDDMQGAQGQQLTHVTSLGEAHMVDVGGKPQTRRVAIAYATVVFSNHEPFKLIFENNNKKGDVLGVSRVAGIMAAKRTPDLIPLCHPVIISKVEVDVNLEAPGAASNLWADNKYGLVSVRALVECDGATGVEMEALTATSSAALTVYDMCKAVDRSMKIGSNRVLYKSGGRSGIYAYQHRVDTINNDFLRERGLEIPQKHA